MGMYLEADSILKMYGDRQVLTDVYLKLEIGDSVAVWGRNGSGKSTLFKIIFGSERANHLFLRINDRIVKGPAYASGLVSYLSQDDFIPAHLSVITLLRQVNTNVMNEYMKDKIEQMKSCKVGDLSGGALRLLEVLYVLNNATPFVLLDEPFAGMSPVMGESLCDYIRKMSVNKGVMVADHNYRLVETIANRHFLLEDGYLKPIASMGELKQHYLI